MDYLIVLSLPALAILYDVLFGERPLLTHPVMAYGRIISMFDAHFTGGTSKWRSRAYGLLLLLSLVFAVVVPLVFLRVIGNLFSENLIVESMMFLLMLYLLKTSFSMSHMVHEARAVNNLVKERDLEGARKRASYIVSRDTGDLDYKEILSADLECVSESFVDGIFSPMFYFSFFGIYGCQLYRAVNTADSRIGYRNDRYVDFGFLSAKLDDMLNYIPSRTSILVILLAGLLMRLDVKRGWRTYRRYGKITQSPNAGQTMSIYSGLLGVRLEKRGHYIIGEEYEEPNFGHIEKGISLYVLSTIMTIVIATLIIMSSMLPITLI